jgi:hypothetical protein
MPAGLTLARKDKRFDCQCYSFGFAARDLVRLELTSISSLLYLKSSSRTNELNQWKKRIDAINYGVEAVLGPAVLLYFPQYR